MPADKKPVSAENPAKEDATEESDPRREMPKRSVEVGGVTIAVTQWTKPVVESVELLEDGPNSRQIFKAGSRSWP